MQNVLVTGGAGFIGSHLCEKLMDLGYKVTCLDNFLTSSKNNIEHLLGKPNFVFVEADVAKPLNLSSRSFDFVFHLASPASPIDYQNYPEETLLANSMGTLNILKLAKETGSKLLIASTSEIYGDPLEHPQKETYFGNVNTFGPRSCYDESKRFAETATYVYIRKHDIDARIVRIFNTYGPRMKKDDGRVVSNFIMDALNGTPFKIDGDGSQTRSFCYVDDLVDGLIKAMFTEGTSGEVFNLGNPDEFTIKDLAELVARIAGGESEILYSGEFRENDPMRRKPDITKANTVLNWEPKTKLEEGLKKTIEYYKNN
ncbi:MAG: UDP-glucuronate decarboxylase [Candidatus Woesebacteria bacterium GW2011_GWD1_41_12]|uniref:UDP-glucuronate decarboxylase n=4 Tax=Candidatus Woeseibacteriota TaxID=1752722 RepID=A0A0G0WY56_9BACT|nr:MAG: UDP-glucuronate decarboxylase [Candidatus Woesebacteria bacterium GW2011_GWD1_41_12]KKS05682.1 MAG: UDP-glucuronate decarboxylase [Candidatus Woesebacteria bacterium GW2011_GWE1_41_24]KKS17704.1 MAG: UDP-glucuronate decarboxylase [Candidatus Woesebacteria bacterium GW2011_GWA1_41_7]OGM81746.1 MAG: NAD-dependent dehydratase [Candidatus Woesebacteria bacterium RIFOXYB1_FULL_41_13]